MTIHKRTRLTPIIQRQEIFKKYHQENLRICDLAKGSLQSAGQLSTRLFTK